MPRGITPRRPSRSGLHAGARTRVAQPPPAVQRSREAQAASPKPKARVASRSAASSPVLPPKSYNPVARDRIADILKRLDARYPEATCALTHHNAWELLVATILSAQCTDVRVNMVTPELFRKYPTPKDLAPVPPETIEPD